MSLHESGTAYLEQPGTLTALTHSEGTCLCPTGAQLPQSFAEACGLHLPSANYVWCGCVLRRTVFSSPLLILKWGLFCFVLFLLLSCKSPHFCLLYNFSSSYCRHYFFLYLCLTSQSFCLPHIAWKCPKCYACYQATLLSPSLHSSPSSYCPISPLWIHSSYPSRMPKVHLETLCLLSCSQPFSWSHP